MRKQYKEAYGLLRIVLGGRRAFAKGDRAKFRRLSAGLRGDVQGAVMESLPYVEPDSSEKDELTSAAADSMELYHFYQTDERFRRAYNQQQAFVLWASRKYRSDGFRRLQRLADLIKG